MANKYASVVQSGVNNYLTSAELINHIATNRVTPGVVGAYQSTSGVSPATGNFAVNAQGSPNMTVAVSAGKAYVSATPTGGSAQNVEVRSDASENVTIAANASGSTRYDYVYIKVDPDKMNNPSVSGTDIVTLITQRSTSAASDSNGVPANSLLLAIVTVINGAASIANSAISDCRVQVGLIDDGWTGAGETWTYASATTITVPSDATGKYAVGDKIKIYQNSGVKYFYVTGVTSTVLTINGGSDYTLTNTAILNPCYSKMPTPQGFPGFFNFTPTWGTTGTAPALGNGTISGTFRMVNKHIDFDILFQAGSTTTFGTQSFTFTFPVQASAYYISGTGPVNRTFNASGYMEDNGVAGYLAICGLTNSTLGATKFTVRYINSAGGASGAVGATSPWTFGSTDYLQLAGTYRVD